MKPLRLNLALLGLALSAGAGTAAYQEQLRVGMIYDVGSKFDTSFNESAYDGATRAVEQLGIEKKDFEPTGPGQIIQGMYGIINSGFNFIVGVGFNNNASITQVAHENPDLYFALIDDVSPAPNVASVTFKEEEGSYLVGYLAALDTSTNVIGFLGGMDVPIIHRFQAGFTAGAKAARANIKVITQYIGTTPDAWNDPARAKEIASSMRSRGTDIIFAAAGASGKGLQDYIRQVQCLRENQLPGGMKFTSDNFAKVPRSASYKADCGVGTRPMFFIGVDSNQNRLGDYDNNPATLNHGLTSMVKRVDNAVFSIIYGVQHHHFKGGQQVSALKDRGVDYTLDVYNRPLITYEQVALIESIRQKIIAGKVKVPSK